MIKNKNTVSCGFGKWSIGVDKNYAVVIGVHRYPIDGNIRLYDASIDDLKKLGYMFLAEAEKCVKLTEKQNQSPKPIAKGKTSKK